jgi:GMP synthase (glutamine-hydrolysing)
VLNIFCFQHIPNEPSGNLKRRAVQCGHSLTTIGLYTQHTLPTLNDFDALIVMGGLMSVNDEDRYSWLGPEKQIVRSAIKADKPVLGICLGAQMIADVLGAKVAPMGYHEIGYFPVNLTCGEPETRFFRGLPKTFPSLHWHGERFEIPAGTKRLATSQACDNQAFEYGSALGLQFHLEVDREILMNLFSLGEVESFSHEKFVQTRETILKLEEEKRSECESLLAKVVDNWLS